MNLQVNAGFLLEKNIRGGQKTTGPCFLNNRLLSLLFFLLFLKILGGKRLLGGSKSRLGGGGASPVAESQNVLLAEDHP